MYSRPDNRNAPAASSGYSRFGPGACIGGEAPMQVQANAGSPHRTDRKRGNRKRVAPGVYERAGKYLISYIQSNGRERVETLGPKKGPGHKNGLTLRQAIAAREAKRVNV